MTTSDVRHTVSWQLKRIAQTPATFKNWPSLLASIGASRVGRGPESLTFLTRAGQKITVPNVKGAFVPTYEVFAEDCYHLEWFLGDLARRPFHGIDVGAHVGTFSCQLAALNPGVTLDCFEPADNTVDFLRRNVVDNGFGDRITVHNKALAGETGFAVFEQQGAASGLNHLAFGDDAAASEGRRVETVSFDDVVAGARGPIELVKMDCEGGEYDLVYKSSPSSWDSVQRIVLEYHVVPDQTWPELRSWLADVGLKVVREDEEIPGLGLAWLSREPLAASGGSHK